MIDDMEGPSWLEEFEDSQREIGTDAKPGAVWGLENISDVNPDDVVFAGTVAIARQFRAKDGFKQVVAIEPPETGGIARMLKVLDNEQVAAALKPVKRFRIAFGTEPHERQAAEEVARRLGRHRCWQVTLPGKRTLSALIEAVETSEPYPLEGIHVLDPNSLLSMRSPPKVMGTRSINIHELALPTEGRVIIVTGIPNMGKSPFMTDVATYTAANHDRRWGLFSPEMSPWSDLAELVVQSAAGKSLRHHDHELNRSPCDGNDISKWGWLVRERFSFIEFDDTQAGIEEQPTGAESYSGPTLTWLLSRAEDCVVRRGMTDLLCDPFNEVDLEMPPGMREDQWIGRCIQRFNRFAIRHRCNVWVVAHPTKLKPAKVGDPMPVPSIYDVHGGSMWANKAAMMLCVHRVAEETEIHILKSKFARWGRRDDVMRVAFDKWSGQYRRPGWNDHD